MQTRTIASGRTMIALCTLGAMACAPALLAQKTDEGGDVAVFAPPQIAFSGPPMGGGMSGPPVTVGQMDRYTEMLDLDGEQRELAATLHEAMMGEYTALMAEQQREYRALREKHRESKDAFVLMREVPELSKRIREKREALERAFLEDLQLILDDAQTEKWTRVEYERRRGEMLPHAVLSGARVDLVAVLEEIGATPAEGTVAADMLLKYERDLDKALRELGAIREERPRIDFLSEGPNAEMIETLSEVAERRREVSEELADINQRYISIVRRDLEPAQRDALGKALLEVSFPEVYRGTYTDSVFDAVTGFEDLTNEQRSQLDRIREQYTRDIEEANSGWIEAIREAEQRGETGGGFAFSGGGVSTSISLGPMNGELMESRRARRELDQSTLERVLRLLNEEQLARVPERRLRGSGPDGGGAVFIEDINISDGGGTRRVTIIDDEAETGGDAEPGEEREIVIEGEEEEPPVEQEEPDTEENPGRGG